jgi:hypothetical protein
MMRELSRALGSRQDKALTAAIYAISCKFAAFCSAFLAQAPG